MIGFEEAAAIIADAARPIAREEVLLDAVNGEVLAGDVIAAISSPRCDVSAMDGYAVSDADLATLPARLRVVGGTFAGQASPPALGREECRRIFTGGAVPLGADRVVVQEVVARDGEWALFHDPLASGRNIRAAASDFAAGERLLPAGTRMDAKAIVAAAAADLATVEVWRRPRFVVLSTGDELAQPGTARDQAATIPDSVSLGVAAVGRHWGGRAMRRTRLADEPALLEHAASQALAAADLVVVTGGASVGERDFAKAMFGTRLELLFSKVAIKPGKPVWFGHVSGTLILGLPGNPTSAMVTARLFLAPLIAGLAGREPSSALCWRQAPLATPIASCGGRETFARGRWAEGRVELLRDQDSGAQKALASAELLIRRAAGAPASEAGGTVDVLDF